MTKKVAVFTGSRAEYGLLVPVLRLIEQNRSLDLQLIVSGSHLSDLHGRTIDYIYADGFVPAAAYESLLASDSTQATCKSIALNLIDIGEAFNSLRPDYLIVLGDRYEALAASLAAVVHGVPVAHLHGGETSEGALDERFRHAITKLAALHFVAADEFRARIIQMGESPERVFTCGPAVQDVLGDLIEVPRADLESSLGCELKGRLALVVYHPATSSTEDPATAMREILLGTLETGFDRLLVSMPNADSHSGRVAAELDRVSAADERIQVFSNIGQRSYLSLLRLVDVIVGNSSSGIIEAPLLGTPAVNVGDRQLGRPRSTLVFDAEPVADEISAACRQALGIDRTVPADSPYRAGVSMAKSVVDVLSTVDPEELQQKRFRDDAG